MRVRRISGALLIAASASIWLLSCATIFHGKSQTINITSGPPGARVQAGGNTFITPAQVTLRRDSDYTVVAEKNGYREETAKIEHSVDWYTFLGNIIFGGIIGWAIDFSSGSAYELSPQSIDIPLKLASRSPQTPALTPAPVPNGSEDRP